MSDGGGDSGGGGANAGGNAGGGAGGGGNNSGANGGDAAAASASATATNDNDMATPYAVHQQGRDHAQDHDASLDRPPDLAYNKGRLGPSSPRRPNMHPFCTSSQHHSSLDLDDYFTGPRDIQKHSKWPMFLRMHGSILPKMVLPLVTIGLWSALVTCISHYTKRNLGISSILLTVTGFVVGLGLSFRSSTAYERYAEGRRYWAQLMLACQSLGRVFWVHAVEREGENREKDILSKLTALNLLVGFAVALKHKLRHEPYTGYEDLAALVGHLDTYAHTATFKEPEKVHQKRPATLRLMGNYLGVSFAISNPRKTIKRAGFPLGNLPLEILTYLACFADELVTNNQLVIPMHQTLAYNNIAVLNDVMMGTERVLTTPLPIAYSIAISQITWVYVFLLPFQLYPTLHWVTIPATIAASYIILGILFIGREIENPFGQEVNDLPLESYCAQVATELDIIASKRKHRGRDWIESVDNRVLYPLSMSGWHVWRERGEDRVRAALCAKTELAFADRVYDQLSLHGEAGVAAAAAAAEREKANEANEVGGGEARSGRRNGLGRRLADAAHAVAAVWPGGGKRVEAQEPAPVAAGPTATAMAMMAPPTRTASALASTSTSTPPGSGSAATTMGKAVPVAAAEDPRRGSNTDEEANVGFGSCTTASTRSSASSARGRQQADDACDRKL